MNEKYFCPRCSDWKGVIVKHEIETYPVRGENTTVDAVVAYCNCCGEQLWVDEFDSENLRKAFDIYREKHSLLSPKEIKRIREKYSLSQTSFARILGLGDKTITRYENGSIPDSAPNNLIMLSDDLDNFRYLLNLNKEKISHEEYMKALASVIQMSQAYSDNMHFLYYKRKNACIYRFADTSRKKGGLQYVG